MSQSLIQDTGRRRPTSDAMQMDQEHRILRFPKLRLYRKWRTGGIQDVGQHPLSLLSHSHSALPEKESKWVIVLVMGQGKIGKPYLRHTNTHPHRRCKGVLQLKSAVVDTADAVSYPNESFAAMYTGQDLSGTNIS